MKTANGHELTRTKTKNKIQQQITQIQRLQKTSLGSPDLAYGIRLAQSRPRKRGTLHGCRPIIANYLRSSAVKVWCFRVHSRSLFVSIRALYSRLVCQNDFDVCLSKRLAEVRRRIGVGHQDVDGVEGSDLGERVETEL
jgi:hypothetical protein